MRNVLSAFRHDRSGATAIEYGLIATLVGVAIIVGATKLGQSLNGTFEEVATNPALVATPATPAQ